MAKVSADKIDAMMDDASAALAKTDYFTCERLASKALVSAFQSRDYERMSRIALPLQEARRQKRLLAADTGRVFRLSEKLPEEGPVEAGCYLIEPMLVGADGRDLRERADAEETPVLVVVREPKTQLGMWPLVMIGPITVRTRVHPPEGGEPTVDWMLMASEALGDEAISQVDPDESGEERVEEYLDRLAGCPEHEKLHQRLAEACRDAALQKHEGKRGTKQ
jgi:hypothetical protein